MILIRKFLTHEYFSLSCQGNFANGPQSHLLRTQYSIIPVFPHSPPPADERNELAWVGGYKKPFVLLLAKIERPSCRLGRGEEGRGQNLLWWVGYFAD